MSGVCLSWRRCCAFDSTTRALGVLLYPTNSGAGAPNLAQFPPPPHLPCSMVNSVTEHHNWLCLWGLSLEANLQPSLALFALSSAFLAISHHMSPSLVASLAHVWFACVPLLNTRQRSMPVFAHPVPSAALGSQRAQPSLSRPSC
jgi:hypothetical protein